MQLDDPRVRATVAVVPRTDFLPERQHPFADEDRALPLGHGQTCSQPTTVVHLLSLLRVEPGHRVLDVGSGSGWTAALLGTLVGPAGQVIGVELEPALVDRSRASLASYELPWVTILQAEPDRLGRPDEAPYDRILVSAEAGHLPAALVEQLADDGRMVIPVAGRLWVVQRRGPVEPEITRVGAYTFVPLR